MEDLKFMSQRSSAVVIINVRLKPDVSKVMGPFWGPESRGRLLDVDGR